MSDILYICRRGAAAGSHSLIPIAFSVTEHSKHVQQVFCEKCFRIFNMQEIMKFHTENYTTLPVGESNLPNGAS